MSGDLLAALYASIQSKEAVALATVTRHSDVARVGAKAVVWQDRPALGSLGLGEMEAQVLREAVAVLQSRRHQTMRYPEQGIEVFVEVQRRPPQLIIVGAGHIAAPLCRLAALCDFSVTVIDDRRQFANRGRFPDADTVIAAGIQQTVRDLEMDEDVYVVLVTRGHSLDVACLLEIIDRPLAYIGMIGSRRRVRAVFDLLVQERGIDPEKLARVNAPVGLPIAAETPAEIAISIMAEVINVYRGGTAISISDERRAGRPVRS